MLSLKQKAESISSAVGEYLAILDENDENALMFVVRRVVTLKGVYPGEKRNLKVSQKKEVVAFERVWAFKYDKLDLSEDFIHFMTDDGQSLVKTPNMSVDLQKIFLKKLRNQKHHSFTKLKFKKKNLRLLQVDVSYNDNKYYFQIGTSQKPVINLLENRQFIIFISIPIILLLTSFVGLFLTERILQPVNEITKNCPKH